jgi:hypothetical protein
MFEFFKLKSIKNILKWYNTCVFQFKTIQFQMGPNRLTN